MFYLLFSVSHGQGTALIFLCILFVAQLIPVSRNKSEKMKIHKPRLLKVPGSRFRGNEILLVFVSFPMKHD
jgi:hypothetical protein